MIGPVCGVAEACAVVPAASDVSVSVQLPGVQLVHVVAFVTAVRDVVYV